MKTISLALALICVVGLVGCNKEAQSSESAGAGQTQMQTPGNDTKQSTQVNTSPKATINPNLNPDAVVGSRTK